MKTNLNKLDNVSAWEAAKSAVDYPVHIFPLHYHDHNGEEREASGWTNTMRESQFHAIVVDKNSDGNLSTISTVTDTYGTIAAVETYQMLHNDLEEMGVESNPSSVYVSGDGGRHVLSVDIEGQKAPNMSDDIGMQIKLSTSVDGSKKHTMDLVAYDKTNNSEIVGLSHETFNLSARHTRTLKDRHIAFQGTIGKLIEEWNESIMPMLAIMADSKFDRTTAMSLLASLVDDAKFAEKHVKKIQDFYKTQTMEDNQHSVYGVMSGLSVYIAQEVDKNKPEHAERMRASLTKVAQKNINKTMKSLGKDAIV